MNQSKIELCCSYCKKRGTDLKICKGCRLCLYCDTSCQRAHWKDHKAGCKYNQERKEKAKTIKTKRTMKLMNEWIKKAYTNKCLIFMMLEFLGIECLRRISRTKEYGVLFEIHFHYNLHTYIPIKIPYLTLFDTLCDAYQGNQDFDVRTDLENFINNGTKNPEERKEFFFVSIKDVISKHVHVLPLPISLVEQVEIPHLSFEQYQSMIMMDQPNNPFRIELKNSSIFSKWDEHRLENLRIQLKTVLEDQKENHQMYQILVLNALCVGTNQSLHLTHVIIIEMTMGIELGEIKKLESFDVIPIVDAKRIVMENKTLWSLQSQTIKQQFDLNKSPLLLQARIQHGNPNFAIFPVVFVAPGGISFVFTVIYDTSDATIKDQFMCTEIAKRAFYQLQQLKFPHVDSPSF